MKKFSLFGKTRGSEGKRIPFPTTPGKVGNMSAEEFKSYSRKKAEREREEYLAALGRFGLTLETLDEARAEAVKRNYRDGAYHCDPSKPAGSSDNPLTVGTEGCCDTLFFSREKGCWCLTDGLGNGMIR